VESTGRPDHLGLLRLSLPRVREARCIRVGLGREEEARVLDSDDATLGLEQQIRLLAEDRLVPRLVRHLSQEEFEVCSLFRVVTWGHRLARLRGGLTHR
jgi:hypothetical protein